MEEKTSKVRRNPGSSILTGNFINCLILSFMLSVFDPGFCLFYTKDVEGFKVKSNKEI